MKAIVTGAGGQLGQALLRASPAAAATEGLDRAALDITDRAAVMALIGDRRPDLLINAAAYTAVDRAESEPDAARRINRDGAENLALACAANRVRLIHISTDFVFDGAIGQPYRPDDITNPLGVYGLTKREGEEAVLAACPDALVVRTAWVYAANRANFMETMLRLIAERDELAVVADQIGTPTHAESLATALWAMAQGSSTGILHWTDAGAASWYDFAIAIREEAIAAGLPAKAEHIRPIATSDYPTPARRPGFALLEKSGGWAAGGQARHWREELRDAIRKKIER